MTYTRIIWSAWAANPLDYIGRDLERLSGEKVSLQRSGMDFVVAVDGSEISRTMDNAATCAALNAVEAGLSSEPWVKSNVIERHPTGRRYRVLPGTASAGKIGEEVKSWGWGGKDLDLGDDDVRTFANGDIEEIT